MIVRFCMMVCIDTSWLRIIFSGVFEIRKMWVTGECPSSAGVWYLDKIFIRLTFHFQKIAIPKNSQFILTASALCLLQHYSIPHAIPEKWADMITMTLSRPSEGISWVKWPLSLTLLRQTYTKYQLEERFGWDRFLKVPTTILHAYTYILQLM